MPGPHPGARCSVCNNPQLPVIDDLLRAPKRRSYQVLADQFGTSQKAMERHHKRHVAIQDAPRSPQTPHTASEPSEEPQASPGQDPTATVDPADVLTRQLAYLD